jgi:hypothetical protein
MVAGIGRMLYAHRAETNADNDTGKESPMAAATESGCGPGETIIPNLPNTF